MEYFTDKEGKVTVYMYYAIDAGKSEKNIKEEDKECLVWVDIDKVDYFFRTNEKFKKSSYNNAIIIYGFVFICGFCI